MSLEIDVLVEGSGFPHLRGSIVLIKANAHRWLVDCGAALDREDLVVSLRSRGLGPGEIDGVLLTHVHGDHCNNIDLFDDVPVFVHCREVQCLAEFAALRTEEAILHRLEGYYETIHPIYQRRFAQWILAGGGQDILQHGHLQLLQGTADIVEGVTMVESPGHSPGHMSVKLAAHEEIWVVGDLVTSAKDYRAAFEVTPAICWNLAEQAKSLTALAQRAKAIIPGHGAPFWLSDDEASATDSQPIASERQIDESVQLPGHPVSLGHDSRGTYSVDAVLQRGLSR